MNDVIIQAVKINSENLEYLLREVKSTNQSIHLMGLIVEYLDDDVYFCRYYIYPKVSDSVVYSTIPARVVEMPNDLYHIVDRFE